MLVVFGSCELDLAPENTMVDETVYRNANTAEAALLGAYVRLNCAIAGAPNDQNYYANIGYMYLYGDVGTDNLKAQSTSTDVLAMETSQYTDTQHEGFLLDVWRNGYNANCAFYPMNTYYYSVGGWDDPDERARMNSQASVLPVVTSGNYPEEDQAIMDKLGCDSMAELTRYAIREGFLTLD